MAHSMWGLALADLHGAFIRAKISKGPVIYGRGNVEGSRIESPTYIDLTGDLVNCDVTISQPCESNADTLPISTITGKATGTRFHLFDESLFASRFRIGSVN
jgi:hypothetical protein